MIATITRPAAPPGQALPSATSPATSEGPTPRAFLVGFAHSVLLPLLGLAALLTGWNVTDATGWPAAIIAVGGWWLAVAAWLRHRGWPAVTAQLAAWAAPTALVAPLWALSWLSAAGLVVWGPATAVLSIALAAVYDPGLVCRPTRTRRTR